MPGQNRTIREMVEKGLRAESLVEDVPEKLDGAIWLCSLGIPAFGAAWTAVRTAAGDYRMRRTAAGAETHQFVFPLEGVIRRAQAHGLKVLNLAVAYTIGTADATSVDVVFNQITYEDRSGPTVAAYGGTVAYDANHDTAAERRASAGGNNPHLLVASLALPEYQNEDATLITAELVVVMPNTCVFTLLAGGFRVAAN